MTYNLAGIDGVTEVKFDQIKAIMVKSIEDNNYANKANDIQIAKDGLNEGKYEEIYSKSRKRNRYTRS